MMRAQVGPAGVGDGAGAIIAACCCCCCCAAVGVAEGVGVGVGDAELDKAICCCCCGVMVCARNVPPAAMTRSSIATTCGQPVPLSLCLNSIFMGVLPRKGER